METDNTNDYVPDCCKNCGNRVYGPVCCVDMQNKPDDEWCGLWRPKDAE